MTNLCLTSFISALALLALARPVFSQDISIPQSGWALRSVDSQETDAGDTAALRAFDGDPATIWTTQWAAASPPPPHDLQIDLGATYVVSGFRYLPRQDGNTYGGIGNYQFFVSTDGVNWGSPVAAGSFPNSSQEQRVTFNAATARYIRLRALSEVAGHPWTTVAELNVLAAGSSSPGAPQTSGGSGSGSPIPKLAWTLRSVDSQEVEAAYNAALQAFDGNPGTIWATQWAASSPPPPHELQIDLGAGYTVTGFRYLPRQDGLVYGGIGQYEFSVSADGVSWGTPVAAGSFPMSSNEQQVVFAAKNGRYIRLRALSEITGQPWTVIAELDVLSTTASAPVVAPATGSSTTNGGDAGWPIPQSGWRLRSVDSQEVDGANNSAVLVFDGNPNTIWATQWAAAAPPPPHDLQIDLGAVYPVSGFRYLPRQDGVLNGGIGQYQFYVSADGVNWGAAVAAGTFPATSSEQQIGFPAKSGRFIHLRVLSEITGQPWTTIAELNVLSTSPASAAPLSSNQFPAVSLTAAQDPGTGWIALAATASDPDGTITQVDFYNGSTLIRSAPFAPFTAILTNVAAGMYSFTAAARDNVGDRTVSNTVTIAVGTASQSTRVMFMPSADHDTLVTWYGLEIFNAGADPGSSSPVATLNLGKPGIVNGECIAEVGAALSALTPGSYVAVVSAVGEVGMSRSEASPSFVIP